MKRIGLVLGVTGAVVAFSAPAFARCRIHNDTKYSFTIESGNVSNQRVGSHTTTSIADGRIIAKSDDGKSVGGSCTNGGKVKIIEERGVLVLEPE